MKSSNERANTIKRGAAHIAKRPVSSMSKRQPSSKKHSKSKENLSLTDLVSLKEKKTKEGSPISKPVFSATSSLRKADNNRSLVQLESENMNFNALDISPEGKNPEKELKIVIQENKILRKKLQEAQARTSILTKELAETQHNCSLSELQTKRNDAKFKDVNSKLSRESERVQELAFLNAQLTEEIAQLRISLQEERASAQEKFEALRRSFQASAEKSENKTRSCMNLIKALKISLRNNDAMTVMARAKPGLGPAGKQGTGTNLKPLQALSRLEKILEGHAEAADAREEAFEDFEDHTDLLQSLKEMLEKSEVEAQLLREKLLDCQDRLQEEINKNENIVPQYKLALNKLRANTDVLKKRFEEIHSKKSEEKEAFKKEKLFLIEANEKQKEENGLLFKKNDQLQLKLKEILRQIDRKEDDIYALKQETELLYKKLETYQDTVKEQDAMIKILKDTLEQQAREDIRMTKEERIKEMIEEREKRLKPHQTRSNRKLSRELSPHFSKQQSRRYDSLEGSASRKNLNKMHFDSNKGFGKKPRGEILIDDDEQESSLSKESDRVYTPDLSKSKYSAQLYSSKNKKTTSEESKALKDYLCYSDTEEDDQPGPASWGKGRDERPEEEALMHDIKTLDQEIAEIQNCLAQELAQNI